MLETCDSRVPGGGHCERFGLSAHGRDGRVRVEIPNGHRFIAEVVEAFPGAIESVGLHKPTLEDVFVHETGAAIESNSPCFLLPAATLWMRELVRFWRQKSRVMGVVASPLVFWLLIGYGSNDLARFYSGALVLTVMFSAIFSTISIIEDRREGFLLSMMVSPAPRTSLVLGKILGAATLAWVQGMIFLAFAPLAGVGIGFLELLPVAARDISDFVHPDRVGFRDRLADGIDRRFSRHHEPPAGAHVDGLGRAIPHGHRSRGHGDHVGEPADVFHRPAEHVLRLPNAAPGALVSAAVTVGFGMVLLMISGIIASQKSVKSAA